MNERNNNEIEKKNEKEKKNSTQVKRSRLYVKYQQKWTQFRYIYY